MAFDSGPKVYAFNRPTDPDEAPSHTGRIGLGTYYSKLGMRHMDRDRRIRELKMTGKDSMEVQAAYNVDRNKR